MIICKCGSTNIKHEEKVDNIEPKKLVINGKIFKPSRRIPWKGYWDVWICEDCGYREEELKRYHPV